MPLQNFVDGSEPTIDAAWLNAIDAFYVTLFGSATTAAAARTAIGAAALAGLSTQDFAAKLLAVSSLTPIAGTATVAPIVLTAGTNLTTPTAGSFEYDGKAFYITPAASNRCVLQPAHISILSSAFVGTDVATAQPFLAAAQDTITLQAGVTYLMEASFYLSRAAGTTAHTISTLFGGTATFTSIDYDILSTVKIGAVLSAVSAIHASVATATVVTASNNDATENNSIDMHGVFRVNAGGTVIPQFQYSAAPGGVPTVAANSYIKFTPIGSSTVTTVGNWS
jgi:hypothetical protein